MADLRKEQIIKSSDIKNNPLKGKRRKKEVLKGTEKIDIRRQRKEHPNKKKERLK